MLITSSTYHPPRGRYGAFRGYGKFVKVFHVNVGSDSDTGESIAALWSCQNFLWKKDTQLLSTSSKREISLSLGLKQVFFKNA